MPQTKTTSLYDELSASWKESKPVAPEAPSPLAGAPTSGLYNELSESWANAPKKTGTHPWKKELSGTILEGSPFLRALMLGSNQPAAQTVAQIHGPEMQKRVDVKQTAGNIKEALSSLTHKLFGPSFEEYRPGTPEHEEYKQKTYKSVMQGVGPGSTPENIVPEGGGLPGQLLGEIRGLANFIPGLLGEFVTDPAKTIQERPIDILLLIEGAAGPKLRLRAKSAIAKFKAGVLTDADMQAIFREIGKAEPGQWKTPEVGEQLKQAVLPLETTAAKETNAPIIKKTTEQMTDAELLAESNRLSAISEQRFNELNKKDPYAAPRIRDQEGFFYPDELHLAQEINQEIGRRQARGAAQRVIEKRTARIAAKGRQIPGLTTKFTGEAGWSPEALSRQKTLKFSMFDTKTGKTTPIIGVDAIDVQPRAGQIKYQTNTRTGKTEVVAYGPETTGRQTPGLMAQFVDEKGQPLSMADFLAKTSRGRIQAAEDLAVALSGQKLTKPTEPTEPPSPGKQLTEAVAAAKKLGPEQAAIITKTRGQRMAQFERTAAGVTGEARAGARTAAQAGEMKKVSWEGIRDKFKPEAVDGYFDMIDRYPGWNEFDKMAPSSGLRKILDGELPEPAEIDAMSVVFGKELADTLVAKRDMMSKGLRFLYEAGNLPRSIMASYDLSAPLRQGIFMISHPKLFWNAFKGMPGYWLKPSNFEALQNAIVKDPNFLLARKSDLGLTDVKRFIKGREERFASTWAEKIPGVQGSERAYVGGLNKLRMDTFNYLVNMADRKFARAGQPEMSPYKNLAVSKKVASIVNNATGRGGLKGAVERSALGLNSLFFSPRLMASRLNLINPATYIKLPKYVRGWAIRTAVEDLAIAGTVLGAAKEVLGAEVSFDFHSPDFMKIKVGNTRLDVMGGFSQYYRTIAQSLNWLYKHYITKEKTKGGNAADILSRFFSYKEAPSITFLTGFLRGKNIMGEPFNLPKEVEERLLPMMGMDIWDAIKDDPTLAKLLMVTVPGTFGVGVQTYEERPTKKGSLWR